MLSPPEASMHPVLDNRAPLLGLRTEVKVMFPDVIFTFPETAVGPDIVKSPVVMLPGAVQTPFWHVKDAEGAVPGQLESVGGAATGCESGCELRGGVMGGDARGGAVGGDAIGTAEGGVTGGPGSTVILEYTHVGCQEEEQDVLFVVPYGRI